jgi:hypothetical protein
MEDSLKITENQDGSFTMDWDPQDPKWSFMNGLTSNEIQVIIEQAIKRTISMTSDYKTYSLEKLSRVGA